MRIARVDFNDMRWDGTFLAEAGELRRGMEVVLKDHEGNTARAVVAFFSENGDAVLSMIPGSWKGAP